MLGKTGQIYFPKLSEEQVLTFSEIAKALLRELGYEPLECKDEQEAIAKAKAGDGKQYPVYFSKSDTTGEKPYEEFYTEDEEVNLAQYKSLGVITVRDFKTRAAIEELIRTFATLFEREDTKKEDITQVMKAFLVNFDHKETGKYLDAKM